MLKEDNCELMVINDGHTYNQSWTKFNPSHHQIEHLITNFSKIEADLRIAKEKNTELSKNICFNKFDK